MDQVRAAEAVRLAELPVDTLMRRAATGLTAVLTEVLDQRMGRVYGTRVVALVGSGDNGGDALHAGADLAARGVQVHAVLLAERSHADALARFTAAGGRVTPVEQVPPVDLVVDGIVGIGGRPGLTGAARSAWEQVRAASPTAVVVAVDLPSGVQTDTGECPAEHVTADLTVTFGTHKVAHLVDPAASACGEVRLVGLDLDLPRARVAALEPADVAALLPRAVGPDHKYTRGVLGVLAGSDSYPGAGVLVVAGASSGLCGMVRFATPSQASRTLVLAAHPEVVPGGGRVQAWAVGSGLEDEAPAALARAVRDAHSSGAALVLDAGALTPAAADPGALAGTRTVLTPHAGELASMLGVSRADVEARRLHHARAGAARFEAVVLLKGRRTLVAAPDGAVRVNTTGTPWLAGAGSGDVLTGVIGSLLAAGLEPFDAASVGAWLHGRAGELASAAHAGGPVVAGDVARALPGAVGDTLRSAAPRVGRSSHE